MRDRHRKSIDESLSTRNREFAREQAQKHAGDVFRAVAMMTREESDLMSEILNKIKDMDVFISAGKIFREYFSDNTVPGMLMVSPNWERSDLEEIKTVLHGWFK
ncbi:MAG TPA: hypothetical protein PKG52_06415 [bacterium]|nr:hypothetical protein [bacterium]HPS30696.1 hypothetical protein [bacterium]